MVVLATDSSNMCKWKGPGEKAWVNFTTLVGLQTIPFVMVHQKLTVLFGRRRSICTNPSPYNID